MYGVPPRSRLQGQTRDNSKPRVFHTKKEHIDTCSYILFVIYVCRFISCLKGFALFYHISHTWNAYVAGNLLKIKKTGNMKHAYNKDKIRLTIFLSAYHFYR